MPGLNTSVSMPDQSADIRSTIGIPRAAALLRDSAPSSQAMTCAPLATSARTVGSPATPSPMTAMRFFS